MLYQGTGPTTLFLTHRDVAEYGFLQETLCWSMASGLRHFKSCDTQAPSECDKHVTGKSCLIDMHRFHRTPNQVHKWFKLGFFFSFFKARASEVSIRWTGAQHPAWGFFWRTACSAGAQRSPICSTGVGLMSCRQILDGLVPKLSCLKLESSSYLWRPQNARGNRKGQQLGILSV